ncbi:MAG: hypothetical protein JO328_17055 [Hyphomicrobiales bacterium]|nr:hypothetical protein [Hyphomicrobiales bacterium]MBV8827036.1 hypothetical protein [Hyphomicrobiales bacterium]
MTDATTIPVSVAIHVVAAGIYGNEARVTVALTPVYDDKNGKYDLVKWPQQIDSLLKNAGLDIVPLDANQSWRKPPFDKFQHLNLTRVDPHHDDSAIVTKYWYEVMGEEDGFASLKTALDPKQTPAVRDPLDAAMRDPEDSNAKGQTPDIHGTWRGKAAAEYSFERVHHVVGRLNGLSSVQTRLAAQPGDSTTQKIQTRRDTPLFLTGPHTPEMTGFRVAALLDDDQAWMDLKGSRVRADKLAAARIKYEDPNTSPDNAVKALVAAHDQLFSRPPSLSALYAGVLSRSGSKVAPFGVDTTEAVAAYQLASRASSDGQPIPPLADGKEVEFARRRLFSLQTNPSLGRLFRFVVDFKCPTDDLITIAKKANPYPDGVVLDANLDDASAPVPAALNQSAYFLLLSLGTGGGGPRLWSATKVRPPVKDSKTQTGHFAPCTREEIDARLAGYSADELRDLAIAEQIDGIVDLGQRWESGGGVTEPRYDILTLDAISATASDAHQEKRRAENAFILANDGDRLPPSVKAALKADPSPTQRGGGLALADRWRQQHAISRHLDSRGQRDTYKSTDVVLDASDLTVGYKLDVAVRSNKDPAKRNRWFPLMHRLVEYKPTAGTDFIPGNLDRYISTLYPNNAARREADDGQLQVPAAMRDWDPPKPMRKDVTDAKRNWVSVFTEEIIGAWRGDPLSLACGAATYPLNPLDLRIDMDYRLPQAGSDAAAATTPPPLRFGWRYHFGLRAVFTGGVVLPLRRARGHYERDYGGDLALPAATDEGRGFRRHERIDAPGIAVPDWMFGELTKKNTYTQVELKGRFPVPQPGRMVVRSFDDAGNRAIAGVPKDGQDALPGVGFDRRVLLAPPVALDFAVLHDAFRGKTGTDIERHVKMCEPRVLREPPNPDDPDTHLLPGEACVPEFVPISNKDPNKDSNNKARQKWHQVKVAWRPYRVKSRPRGGLRSIDYRAAWGGLPVYRASMTVGAVEPVENQAVTPTPPLMTDEGEILHRTKGNGTTIFSNDSENRRTIVWSAIGVLPGDKGQIERSGTSVFRPLPADRRNDLERQPYYPDPAAVSLAVQVAVRGKEPDAPVVVPLYADAAPKGPVPAGYPDAMPVVLDILRGDGKHRSVAVSPKVSYAGLPRTSVAAAKDPSITVTHVTVTLAVGDQATISCWCVPSETFLCYMWAPTETLAALAIRWVARGGSTRGDADSNFVKGFKALLPKIPWDKHFVSGPSAFTGLGGLPLPTPPLMCELAKKIREAMLRAPLPEIAAVTEIEAVHAVDLPQQDPKNVVGHDWALLRATADEIPRILAPVTIARDPLRDPKNWTLENQMPGAIDVLVDATLTIDAPSTGALEIRALGAAAARGRFDDVDRGRSRDDRARGLWPKPDAQNYMVPKRLFGFTPAADGSVTFDNEMVTLLRIEGFGPEQSKINLLDFQRVAEVLENQPNAPDNPWRAKRPPSFPDARARYIKLYAVAISRHANALRTRYDEIPEALDRPILPAPRSGVNAETAHILAQFWLAATIRPPRPVPQTPIPAFKWHECRPTPASPKLSAVFVKRSIRVRIRLKRSWFLSGEGERLGVVIWPPNLFGSDIGEVRKDFVKPPPDDRGQINLRSLPSDGTSILELQDADLGTGGGWVTRWGADPIREHGGVQGWLLSKENFPGVTTSAYDFTQPPEKNIPDALLVENVLMPVPVDDDAQPSTAAQPPGGFMAVSLITYAPRFDPEQEIWHADVDISPCGAVYPFVRLGLVRFQPHAPRALQVSEPVVEWAQIMPERTVRATAKAAAGERVIIEAVAEGAFSQPGSLSPNPKTSPEQAPQMHFSLLRRQRPQDGEPLGPETICGDPQVQDPHCGSDCMTWSASFDIAKKDFSGDGEQWSVFVEEVDRFRPGTYSDEPRYETRKDTYFVDTGPRFTARLLLDNLKVS